MNTSSDTGRLLGSLCPTAAAAKHVHGASGNLHNVAERDMRDILFRYLRLSTAKAGESGAMCMEIKMTTWLNDMDQAN